MTTYTEQIKELCDLNSLHYHIDSNRLLIDDEFWFYINNIDDINNFNVYIDIIKGRNEMVNTICDKLNTTIEKGCNFNFVEYHRNKMVCIHDNCISLNINNLTDICYTKYERFIEFELKIVLKSPLEYYLIDEDDKKKSYKLKSTIDLKNVLDQLCTFEKRKCSKDLCDSMVDMKKDFPNPYGLCNDKSEYMLSTAHGYRNKSSSSTKYYFCSKECMDYFDKYKRCHRCHEDGEGTLIDNEYTLCNGRGDCNPPCIVKYEIEKRYLSEDRNKQLYKIVINYFGDNCKDSNFSLKSDFEELFELIKKNDFRVSYDILTDICYARDTYSLRDISSNDKEVKVCSECGYTKHSKVNDKDKDECYKCNKKLWTEFYYNNDTDTEINGLVCDTCCDKNNDYILLKK